MVTFYNMYSQWIFDLVLVYLGTGETFVNTGFLGRTFRQKEAIPHFLNNVQIPVDSRPEV